MMMSFLVLSLAFLASIYSVESAAIGVRLYSNYARAICSTICSIGCTLALDTMTVPPAHAAISKDSMSRWTDALEELKSLDTNWDTIVKGDHDGDSIRRRLGTVYTPPKCESALCNFADFVPKFMIKNGEDIDIDEFEGPSQDLLLSLNEANAAGFIATYLELSLSEAPLVNNKLFVRFMIMSFTSCYNAIFCPEFATPSASDYIKTSHKQVKMSINSMNKIIKILDAVQ